MKLLSLLAICAFGLVLNSLALPSPDGKRKRLYDPLPAGSADGLYIGTLNDDGTTHWEYFGKAKNLTLPERGSTSLSEHDKRANEGAICQGEELLFAPLAEEGLIEICGNGLNFDQVISYQFNTAIAYGCNYGGGQHCIGSQITDIFDKLEVACGPLTSGWYSMPSWAASYGVTLLGDGFC